MRLKSETIDYAPWSIVVAVYTILQNTLSDFVLAIWCEHRDIIFQINILRFSFILL